MMDGEAADDPLVEIRAALATARERHAALDAEVVALQAEDRPDQIRLARLKKQKLALKDQIVRLENLLTPDLIA
jgi:hypothetical protein